MEQKSIGQLQNSPEFRNFVGTEKWYRHQSGLLFTDGVKYLAETYQCHWLVDLIAFASKEFADQQFQIWSLQRCHANCFYLSLYDGNDNMLSQYFIPYSDFNQNAVSLWLENGVVYLPSER